MFKWFKRDENLEDYDEDDSYTKRDFKITLLIVLGIFCLWGFGNFMADKVSCAYTGYTYEKNTKRPIFSECLIQMKDGSYVPLERYINRVLTFNDLGE
jgi:hypothetical protein